ncbi:MAG: DUF7338 family protein [Pseudomonadales bacterium]
MKYAIQTLKWLVLAPLDFVFNTVALLLFNWWVPFVAVPVKKGEWMYGEADPQWQGHEQRLPRWLSWFETFDASLDTGWISGYFVPKGTYTPNRMPSFWKRKWYQWRWLNRNSGYSFSYYPLGIEMDTKKWTIRKWINTSGEKNKGFRLWFATSSDGHWNLNVAGKYGAYKLGWKAWNYWDRDIQTWYRNGKPWGPEMRTTLVLSANPFKREAIPLLDPENAS